MGDEGAKKGWYPDPEGSGRLRWWDGSQWGDRFKDGQGGGGKRRITPLLLAGLLLAGGLVLAGAVAAFVLVEGEGSGEERIVFMGADGESLRTVATDGSDYQRVVAGVGSLGSWDVSPDGRLVAFGASRESEDGEIYLTDLESEDRALVGEGYSPIFSPDGSQVAFTREESRSDDESRSIAYLHDVRSGQSRRVGRGYPVGFVSGGRGLLVAIGYGEERDYRSDVAILDFKGNADVIGEGSSPALSEDGRLVAYSRDESEDEEDYEPTIFATEIGSDDVVRVTEGESPVFSPDGGSIAYTRSEGEDESWENVVRIVDLESGEERRIAEGSQPVFAPDGSSLLVVQSTELGDSYLEEIRMVVFESGDEILLAEGEGPRFSADGARVVYARDLSEESWEPMIHVADVETGTEQRLTEGSGPDFYSAPK